ncbi:hypothetical protein [Mesorhizobium sp.]|uniref:hypothetical protein n=1 Tax=Mesorhizobium sp. TaxID=1871066 RepID=UPI0025C4E219|nr:hypothetical protein [Mesorhizobium sp.]
MTRSHRKSYRWHLCDIKGNIDARGEHIYHMPGQGYYDRAVNADGPQLERFRF